MDAQAKQIVKAHIAALQRAAKCLAEDLAIAGGVDAAIVRAHYREMAEHLDRIGIGLGMRKPSVVSLTQRQREIFGWIAMFIEVQGIAPTYQQIGAAMGISSMSTINKHIFTFERLGLITRDGRNWTITAAVQ